MRKNVTSQINTHVTTVRSENKVAESVTFLLHGSGRFYCREITLRFRLRNSEN